jgi:acylphosphatase
MFVLEQARALGLRGWVRNTFDGKVEVTAEGSRAALETLLDKIRQGPRMALVTEVQKEWQAAANEFSDFDVRRTV